MVYPNPLNPNRYVLLNSGIDFRADAYGSNAKQTPKLPDYAIVDVTIIAALFVTHMNLVVDIVYAFLDPRVRYS